MDELIILGLIAGALPIISFVAQVIQIYKTKDTKAISLVMYIFFCSGVFLWIIYGIIKKDVAIIFANGLTFILACTVLGMKIKYK